MIRMRILGEPVAQHRPRITTAGKFPRMYKVAKDITYREKLYWEAKQLNIVPADRSIQLCVDLKVFRAIPKSLSKIKRESAIKGRIRPTTKPDIDNYVKQVFDALNGLIWEDDAQIVTVHARKFYDEIPRLEIDINTVNSDAVFPLRRQPQRSPSASSSKVSP